MADGTFQLEDGRILSYAEFGDPSGSPVFAFHGNLSSRLDMDFADDCARSMRVRLISVDRPGMGLSDYQRKRTLLDWPVDVEALANHLQIATFGVYGWSAGGQYALACAKALAPRVTSVVVSGCPRPYETLRGIKGIEPTDQMLITGARFAPFAISGLLNAMVVRASDERLYKLITSDLPDVDLAYIESMPEGKAVALLRESFRQGTKGNVRDFKILGAPWGFVLDEVTVPVHVWTGTEDTYGPADESAKLVEALPNASLHTVEGEGHFSLPPSRIHELLQPFSLG